MKKVLLFHKDSHENNIGEFDCLQDAQEKVIELVENDENLSIFDYYTKEVEYEDVLTTIPDYEAAKDSLGCVGVKIVTDVREHHFKALSALNELFTIAEAWNKADNFVPDFSNRNQYKWFPWFVYNSDTAGFVWANTHTTATYANANVGSRLCFKSEERATQFGKQFIDLWNDFLLFR